MQKCAFCAEDGLEISAGGLRLCARCRDQLCALEPGEQRYFWYVRAVSRALWAERAGRAGSGGLGYIKTSHR